MGNQIAHQPSRRVFLKGRFDRSEIMRPPGALDPENFAQTCTHCGDCAAACPQAIIVADEDGLPKVDLSRRACTFCGDCATACEVGAIEPATAWDWRADVSAQCLSLQGITCRSCEDQCDEVAIRFRLMTEGRSAPLIDIDRCTGCGACAAICPSDAIQFKPQQQASEASHVEHLRMSGSRSA